MTIERPKLLFLTPRARRLRLPSLGAVGAVGLMLLAGLNPQYGGKVVWSPQHGVVVWASPDSERPVPSWVYAAPIPLTTTVFKVAGDTSFANPGDWNDANNRVEAIGKGGKGGGGGSAGRGNPGGGAGAYASQINIPLLANGDFPITLQIGPAGGNASTQFNFTHVAARRVGAQQGADASATAIGTGGAVVNCVPSTALSGGVGATAGGSGGAKPGIGVGQSSAGGGAGGPNGAGSTGGTPSAGRGGTGGAADGGTVSGPIGGNNTDGTTGNSGTQFDATHGCGTGGSGAGGTVGNLGGAGGNYGGSGGGSNGVAAGPNGAAGLLIISYTPAVSIIPEIMHQRRMRHA